MQIQKNNIECIYLAYVNRYSNPWKLNPLGQSLIFDEDLWNIKSLKILLDKGFNINQTDFNGRTPIFYCRNKIQFMLLLAMGANINHTDKKGKNILFYPNEKDIVELILKLNINIKTKDSSGHYFISHNIFHEHPVLFKDVLSCFKDKEIEIFQVFQHSDIAIKNLLVNSIKISIKKNVMLMYDPDCRKNNFRNLLIILQDHLDDYCFSQIKFIYNIPKTNITKIYDHRFIRV